GPSPGRRMPAKSRTPPPAPRPWSTRTWRACSATDQRGPADEVRPVAPRARYGHTAAVEPLPAVRRIVMLGPPAAGKGTQGLRLAPTLGVPHLSAGELLRSSVAEGDPHGLSPFLLSGEL